MQLIFIPKTLLKFKLILSFILLFISNTVYGGPNDERPTTLVPITKGERFYMGAEYPGKPLGKLKTLIRRT